MIHERRISVKQYDVVPFDLSGTRIGSCEAGGGCSALRKKGNREVSLLFYDCVKNEKEIVSNGKI